eukprot:1142638-Pelagomonas_calceolata.AAC.5
MYGGCTASHYPLRLVRQHALTSLIIPVSCPVAGVAMFGGCAAPRHYAQLVQQHAPTFLVLPVVCACRCHNVWRVLCLPSPSPAGPATCARLSTYPW